MRIPTFLLALALAAGLAFAQEDGERRRRGPQLDKLQETLSLTDTQLQALRDNSAAMREEIRAATEGARETREAMREEMAQDNPNEAIIAQHLTAMSEVRDEVEAIRARFRDSALALLDESQKAKLAEIEAAMELARLAPGAAALNLIEAPQGHRFRGPGFGPRGKHGPHGPQGPGGRFRPGPPPPVE